MFSFNVNTVDFPLCCSTISYIKVGCWAIKFENIAFLYNIVSSLAHGLPVSGPCFSICDCYFVSLNFFYGCQHSSKVKTARICSISDEGTNGNYLNMKSATHNRISQKYFDA